jgi:lipopolysaccharide/colanic/teichoic acid biosynthesis glycosyltransferase
MLLFYTMKDRRHIFVRQQVSGREAISWDEKLNFNVIYAANCSFAKGLRLVLEMIAKVFSE